MNWFRKILAQQQYLWTNDPQLPYANDVWEPSGILEQDIEDCENEAQLLRVLQSYGFGPRDFDEEVFHEGQRAILFDYGNDRFIVELNFPRPKMENALTWIESLGDISIYGYLDPGDFNQEFWDSVGQGQKVYHGTYDKHLPLILKKGLLPKYESRGLENQYTGAAVFTTEQPDAPAYYSDVVVEIDVGQMKADGYMPRVGKEEPIEEAEIKEALAHKIGLEDYRAEVGSDYWPDTIIFYDAIPAKYIRVHE
jgi:hypothetical protein